MSAADIGSIAGAVIGLVTFIGNIFLYYKTRKETRHINNTNSMAKYYNEIFDEYLIDKIPSSREYIRFKEGSLKDFRQLTDTLDSMAKKALYFKYSNQKFYRNLKKKIESFEDYLADCGNHKYDQDEQSEIILEIGKRIEDLYCCINNSYQGSEEK